MPSDRLTGFSSAFDEMLERSRRELDALSGGSDAPALSPTPRTSSRASSRTSLRTPPRTSSEPAGNRPSEVRPSTPARDGPDRSARTAPASRSPAERALDEKLGADWRYEVLERTREGGELVVRCRVTAPARGVSRTWYGSAPMPGAGHRASNPGRRASNFGRRASNFGRGASGMRGKAGNVSFTLGARVGTGAGVGANNPARSEREAERQAVESALAACARLL